MAGEVEVPGTVLAQRKERKVDLDKVEHFHRGRRLGRPRSLGEIHGRPSTGLRTQDAGEKSW